MRDLDQIIDRFVEHVNASDRPSKLDDEIALSVAEPSPEDRDYWTWSIRPYGVTWLSEIEAGLPRRLPTLFRSFVSRYIFPEFDWGPVMFFANTPEKIGYDGHELRIAIYRDRALFEVLSRNGYLQFGQPSDGSYDPVCFAPSEGEDAPVVRLDHEQILIDGGIRVVDTIARSFESLIERPVV
jgi:hypothetical protein